MPARRLKYNVHAADSASDSATQSRYTNSSYTNQPIYIDDEDCDTLVSSVLKYIYPQSNRDCPKHGHQSRALYNPRHEPTDNESDATSNLTQVLHAVNKHGGIREKNKHHSRSQKQYSSLPRKHHGKTRHSESKRHKKKKHRSHQDQIDLYQLFSGGFNVLTENLNHIATLFGYHLDSDLTLRALVGAAIVWFATRLI